MQGANRPFILVLWSAKNRRADLKGPARVLDDWALSWSAALQRDRHAPRASPADGARTRRYGISIAQPRNRPRSPAHARCKGCRCKGRTSWLISWSPTAAWAIRAFDLFLAVHACQARPGAELALWIAASITSDNSASYAIMSVPMPQRCAGLPSVRLRRGIVPRRRDVSRDGRWGV
jgi:hypothetical protein